MNTDTLSCILFMVAFGLGYLARWASTRPPSRAPRLMYQFSYTPPVKALQPEVHIEEWTLALTCFCFHGNMLGWSQSRMVCQEKLVTRTAWETYTRLLSDSAILSVKPRTRTRWAGGWNYPKLRTSLKHHILVLPYPEHSPPPIYSAHSNSAASAAQRTLRKVAQT